MSEKGHCSHGEFPLFEGCPQCIADRMAIAQEAERTGTIPDRLDVLPMDAEVNSPENIRKRIEEANQRTVAQVSTEDKKPVPPVSIVKVQFYSETTGKGSLREYTYFSEDRLEVGDMVSVPVKGTLTKGKVSAVDVPESEIAAYKHSVKTIPAGAKLVNVHIKVTAPPGAPVGEEEKVAREIIKLADTIAEIQGLPKPEAVDTKINLCDTCMRRKEYPICSPRDVKFGDGIGNDNIIECESYKDEEAAETAVALRPGADAEVMVWHEEALKALHYAKGRQVTTGSENKMANDDLSLISKLRKQMEAKKKELLVPLKTEMDAIRDTYTFLMEPILEADKITRGKMTAYLQELARISAETDRINRQRLEAAEAESKLKGEIAEPVVLMEPPAPAPRSVKTELGSSGLTDHWTYEITDVELLPKEYMLPDEKMLGMIARNHHDKKPVAGVRFFNKPFIQNRAR